MWQVWVNFIIGLWLFISGLVASLQTGLNFIICGILLVILTIIGKLTKKWQGLVVCILGIWAILSGIISGLAGPVNFIIVGIVVAILSILLVGKKEEKKEAA
jgi:hypothetical protein